MNALIRWSLASRSIVVGLAVALIVIGGLQLRDAPVDVLPEYSPPYVEIQTEALGLSAAEVEQFVTVPMEALMLNGVAFVESVRSESVPGLSSIVLIFEPGTDLYRARQMVQERMSHATALPRVAKPPQMIQPLSSASRVMIVGLSSPSLAPTELSVLARWTIRPRLMGVEGVANVAIWGHRERQLQVLVDPERLHDRGVTLDSIVSTTGNALWVSPLSYLRASTPGAGGFIDTPNQRLGIRHVLPISTPEDLARVPIDGHPSLRIGDVAEVVQDHQPLIGDASTTAGDGLLLVIEKLPGENTLDVTRDVEAALAALQPGLPGVTVDANVYRPAAFIESAMASLGLAIGIAAVLIAAIVGAFLLRWRAVVIAIVSIVVSVIAAAVVLVLLGQTINALLVAGLSVGIAVVVDDVIVDVDHAIRRLRERTGGEQEPSVQETLAVALAEIRGPSVAATLAILLLLIPVVAIGGITGAFLLPFALSFVAAVVTSLIVGLTVTPALAAFLLADTRNDPTEPRLVRTLHGWHQRSLGATLRRPIIAYVGLAIVGVAALATIPQLRPSIAPSFSERDVLIDVAAAPGTSRPAMDRVVDRASEELRALPGIRGVGSHVGRAIMSDQVVNVDAGQIWVSMDPQTDAPTTLAEIRSVVAGYPGLALAVDGYLSGQASDVAAEPPDPVAVRVFGPDLGELERQAESVRASIADIPGVVAPRIVATPVEATVEVEVDLEAAASYGVKPGDVRRAAATLISGLEVGNLFEEQKVFEVVVVGVPAMRHSLTSIQALLIDTPTGDQVALRDLATVRIAPSPVRISREGISRYLDVVAGVEGRDVAAVQGDVSQALAGLAFPMEYHPEISTAWADEQADLQRLVGVLIAVLAMTFLVLQAALGSWRLAAASMIVLPVALAGGVIAVWLVGGQLSLGSTIGFIAILAIAVRNEVALVERLRSLERHGIPSGPTLVMRGSRERLGPIVMTASALAAAFIPILVLGDRPGFELLRPLAVVVLGGLVTTTLLNLFVVPSLYLDLTARPAGAAVEVALPQSGEPQSAGAQ